MLKTLIFPVQDHRRHGVMLGVAEGNERGNYAALGREFLRGSGKDEKRLAVWFFLNVDVAPTHCFADASAESFRNRFFRCKTRGQMTRRKFHRHGIFNFAIGEDAMKKAIAEAID